MQENVIYYENNMISIIMEILTLVTLILLTFSALFTSRILERKHYRNSIKKVKQITFKKKKFRFRKWSYFIAKSVEMTFRFSPIIINAQAKDIATM